MSKALSVQDVIKNSILESDIFQSTMTAGTVATLIISLLVSLIMGLLIYFIHKRTYRGVVYSQTFATTLVGMTVLTCMVTLAISTNIVLSLGMVGALSIVRYRSAIKEPFDLMFLFWAITTGITVGASMYLLSVLGAVVVIPIAFLLGKKGGSKVFILVIRYRGNDITDDIKRIMKDKKYSIKSKTTRKGATEMAVEVYVKNDNLSFTEAITALERVDDLTLVQYNGEYHG